MVEKLLNEERLDTVHRPEDSSLREVVERAWVRDSEEIRQAELRVEGLRSTQELGGVLTLDAARQGLGNSPEIKDLLYYLSNAIVHFASAYRRPEKGKLIQPCLTDPDHWHMSLQNGWVRARRTSLDKMG